MMVSNVIFLMFLFLGLTFTEGCYNSRKCSIYYQPYCMLPLLKRFMTQHCSRLCGFCTKRSITGFVADPQSRAIYGKCSDTPKCNPLYQNYCTVTLLRGFLTENCAKTCGFCTERIDTDNGMNGKGSGSEGPEKGCSDTQTCNGYLKNYCTVPLFKVVMTKHCAKSCGFCPGGTTTATEENVETAITGTTTEVGTGIESGTDARVEPGPRDPSKAECLKLHNIKRRLHRNTPDLAWDDYLAASAQDYAEYLVQTGKFEHSRQTKVYGENLYKSFGSYSNGSPCNGAVTGWYDKEIGLYNFYRPGYVKGAGHFTQMVWKGSRKLGVGIATIGRETVVVAHYSPPGNVIGRFKENVMRLK